MTREQVIQMIESLFPADSEYGDVAETGRELILRALADQWRNLPTPVLTRYLELCIDYEKRNRR